MGARAAQPGSELRFCDRGDKVNSKTILLIEGNPSAVELAKPTFEKDCIANESVVPTVAQTTPGEGNDVVACYDPDISSHKARAVGFRQFAEAIEQPGPCILVLNEPPSKVKQS